MKSHRITAVAVLAAALVGACGGGSDKPSFSARDAQRFVQRQLSFRAMAADTTPGVYRTLDETLPNVTYLPPDRGPTTVTDLVVVGTVTSVKKGRAFVVHGEDAPSGTPADFDTQGARWWLVHATIDVERSIGSSETPEEITVALPLDSPNDFPKMAAGLQALGRAVFFLDKDTPHTPYDRSLYVVIENHALIAQVAADGTLSLPFVEPSRASTLLAGLATLADLDAKAAQPRAVPVIPAPGGYYVRADQQLATT